MRTTVTLDPDTVALVRRLMERKGISFKQALNDAIRAGAGPAPRRKPTTHPRDLGRPLVDLDHALRIAADLEDDELVRRMSAGT